MLAMDFIRENREAVEQAIRDKAVDLDLDALLALDVEVRGLKGEIEALRAERNAISGRFQSASPEERAELGAKAKAAGAQAGDRRADLFAGRRVGLGRIGSRVAHMAQAFGMRVLATGFTLTAERAMAHGVQMAALRPASTELKQGAVSYCTEAV